MSEIGSNLLNGNTIANTIVVGTCFVTGVGEKATIDKILEILSK